MRKGNYNKLVDISFNSYIINDLSISVEKYYFKLHNFYDYMTILTLLQLFYVSNGISETPKICGF